ncbi:tRNA pseudouridine(38-40) synthase TruA [Ornithinimicrobium sp. Arc0846-15]|nr:tRNA pseudouridine(38-40) synthase TruA [Ornithinimicrobium laminariae]
MRLRLDVAYDGTEFYGWATQPGFRTVEETISNAWGVILRSEPPNLVVGGRTDAGVHARGSVVHLDVNDARLQTLRNRGSWTAEQAARQRLKGVLPDDILVKHVSRAPKGFDARFSALHRRYEYRIADSVPVRDPLRRRDTVNYDVKLDVEAMDEVAQTLCGLHDFAAFCRRREGATTVRTLLKYRWRRDEAGVLIADVQADAFCHSMVRALVGAIVRVGEGKFTAETVKEILLARQRDSRMTVMPAHGLSLEEIVYPPDHLVGQRAEEARATRSLPGPTSQGA